MNMAFGQIVLNWKCATSKSASERFAVTLRIIPVIDLKDGQVVRGIAGRREEYRPVESIIATDAQPATVAKAFVDLGLSDVYVADLDAIAGAEPAWASYRQMARCGARLTIDAGLCDSSRAAEMAEFHTGRQGRQPLGATAPLAHSRSRWSLDFVKKLTITEVSRTDERRLSGIVAGLESLSDADSLTTFVETIGTDRLIFSLDLSDGRPLTEVAAWRALDAMRIAEMATCAGIRRMIVLDLHRVGTGQGVGTEPLCRNLADRYPETEIIAGGGVRNLADLHSLAAAGCSAALVASALHDGRIGEAEIRAAES